MKPDEIAFWREAYLAAIRAGVAASAKHIADKAVADYSECRRKLDESNIMQSDPYF